MKPFKTNQRIACLTEIKLGLGEIRRLDAKIARNRCITRIAGAICMACTALTYLLSLCR